MQIEQLGPYKISRKLGRGGMGTVYEGVNQETGEPAAVKLLSAALAHEVDFRQRFQSEIETLRKLNHPNIVRLFGFGQQEEQLFYAMELVPGSSLEEELGRGRSFAWREVTRIGADVARALRHAHDRGVIHRDIKPGNLLLTADGQVKLSDFGIARLFGGSQHTIAGSVLGTAEFMSPEQAEGRPVGPARRSVQPGRRVVRVVGAAAAVSRQIAAGTPAQAAFRAATAAGRVGARRAGRTATHHHATPGKGPRAANSQCGRAAAAAGRGSSGPSRRPCPPMASRLTLLRRMNPCHRLRRAVLHVSMHCRRRWLPTACRWRRWIAAQPARRLRKPSSRPPISPASARMNSTGSRPLRPRRRGFSLQTIILAAGLLGIGAAIWYMLRPPSAAALLVRIEARASDNNPDSLRQAEDDIQSFLKRFPNDSHSPRLRQYEREIDLDRLQRKFERRAKGLGLSEPLLPVEQAYLDALNYSRLNPELGMAKFQALIDLYGEPANAAGPAGQCLELARRQLARLREQFEPLAVEQLNEVKKRLDRADQLRRAEPERAQAMYRAVIELYASKPWAAGAVRRARESLKKK